MVKEEKLDKLIKDFTLLSEEKQDHILGVLQALAFAHNTANGENISFDPEKNTNFEEC